MSPEPPITFIWLVRSYLVSKIFIKELPQQIKFVMKCTTICVNYFLYIKIEQRLIFWFNKISNDHQVKQWHSPCITEMLLHQTSSHKLIHLPQQWKKCWKVVAILYIGFFLSIVTVPPCVLNSVFCGIINKISRSAALFTWLSNRCLELILGSI